MYSFIDMVVKETKKDKMGDMVVKETKKDKMGLLFFLKMIFWIQLTIDNFTSRNVMLCISTFTGETIELQITKLHQLFHYKVGQNQCISTGIIIFHSMNDKQTFSLSVHLLLLFLLELNNLIVAHGRQNNHHVRLVLSSTSLEGGGDFTGKVIRPLRKLDVLTGFTFSIHEGDETVIGDIKQGVLLTGDERNIGVVGGRDDIFVLLAVEDINGSEVALSVTVLASLGGRDVSHLM